MYKLILGLILSVSAQASELFIDFKGNKVIIEQNGQIFTYTLTKEDEASLKKGDSDAIFNRICERLQCPKKNER